MQPEMVLAEDTEYLSLKFIVCAVEFCLHHQNRRTRNSFYMILSSVTFIYINIRYTNSLKYDQSK